MTIDDHGNESLNPAAANALRALQRDEPPPPHLYANVARGLRARRLMRGRPRWSVSLVSAAAGLAAGLVIGFFGARQSGSFTAESQATTRDPSFALFLMASDTVRYPASLSEMDRVELYRAWARRLAAAGQLSFGEELVPRRYAVDRMATREAGQDGSMDGMFVVQAPSADSAMALAGTLPHVQYGGTVIVQEIARR